MKRYIRSNTSRVDLESILPADLPVKKYYSSYVTRGVDIDKAISILLKDGWRADKWTHTGKEILHKDGESIKIWNGESPKVAMIQLVNSSVKASKVFPPSASVNSSWFVGEPDPTGQLEGDARFMNSIKSWNDVYNEFQKIVDRYFPDTEKIMIEVENFYDHYRQYRNSPNWKYFEEAYSRWNDYLEENADEFYI